MCLKKKLWEKEGHIRVINIRDKYFVVSFSHEVDYKFAFQEGTWVVMDYYLIVQRWRLDFLLEKDVVKRVVVWFGISRLSLDYCKSVIRNSFGD